ncbi:GPI anchored peptidase m48 [Grosmannia clavigera kw1407]|uniref:GPI anchored peptidase m48 n=1 Tax=Grosmannia clavigera (strain kw1407 / UAMH 11150) TaxID=655863 RepID=F0XC09_GROCL|nr:GPI anchored peptidase m48 [Grosmannia clavigera kw1407]EFX04311.1 GPI anchored peptidase m48 [Grosmannia clavigera kw1407]
MAHLFLRLATTAAMALSLTAPVRSTSQYVLDKQYDHTNFFDEFDFINSDDPSNGYVDYQSQSEALTSGLAKITSDNTIILAADSSLVPDDSARGRKSVRVEGSYSFTHGLIVADFAHLPALKCGLWPAFWMYGEPWPTRGELDVYEVYNLEQTNVISLHTDHAGTVGTCDLGCGVAEDDDPENPFSVSGDNDGGIYAAEWTEEYIKVWSWKHGDEPADLKTDHPNPSTWGTPRSYVGTPNCDMNNVISEQHLVLNLDFCGDGAGNNFEACSALNPDYAATPAGCASYVQSHPSQFVDAYFEVSSIKIYGEKTIVSAATTSSNFSTASLNTTTASTSGLKATSTNATSLNSTLSATLSSTTAKTTPSYAMTNSTAALTAGAVAAVSVDPSSAVSADEITMYSTVVSTIYSCAPTITDCPYGKVTTMVVAVAPSSTSSVATSYSTSIFYSTAVSTIYSCAPTITDCPYGKVTTMVYAVTTTVCPVTETLGASIPSITSVASPAVTTQKAATTIECSDASIVTEIETRTKPETSAGSRVVIAVVTAVVVPASSSPVSTAALYAFTNSTNAYASASASASGAVFVYGTGSGPASTVVLAPVVDHAISSANVFSSIPIATSGYVAPSTPSTTSITTAVVTAGAASSGATRTPHSMLFLRRAGAHVSALSRSTRAMYFRTSGLATGLSRADLFQKSSGALRPQLEAPAALARRRPFVSASPRGYNYEPNDQRQGRRQVYKAVPVMPQEMPPRSSFNSNGQGYSGGSPPRRRSFLWRTIHSTSMRAVMVVAMVGALGVYFTHLEVVPVSGRRRFNCFGEDSMRLLGEIQYEALMEEAREQGQRFLPDYDPRAVVVRHVMRRLIPVSGMSDGEGEWEIRVIDDARMANAFVLPGGKVFVFSGIFAIARSEDALAAVLGHELAHNLANHHGERASSAIGTTILLTSAFLLTAGLAYFVLRPVVDLVFNSPMSRLQESEADYIGLMLMAEACYDPAQAADFWRRMDLAQKTDTPEWTSTHPSNQHRLQKIQEWLPEALEKRSQSACDGTQGFAEKFKRAMRQGVILVA